MGAFDFVGDAWNSLTGQYDPNEVPNLQNDVRKGQVGAQQELSGWALKGEGPSAAQTMLDHNRATNTAQQIGAAKSMGGDPALANRMAAEGITQGNAQATYQASILRAQEQQQAMENYLNQLNATRSQDLGYQNAMWNIGQGNSSRAQDAWMGLLSSGGAVAGGAGGGGGGAAAGAGGGGAAGGGGGAAAGAI